MSPRLLYLLTVVRAPSRERDRVDARTATARMPGRRQPRSEYFELVLAA